MQTALSIQGLKKTYANQLTALKEIDLSVNQGDFFALLGSNGAGKTTEVETWPAQEAHECLQHIFSL